MSQPQQNGREVAVVTFADTYRKVEHELTIRIAKVEELLPPLMKGQAERLIKRALLTFSGRPELHAVTPLSFLRCVLQAAEFGLAIDGRLAHAVARNNKVKGADGKDKLVNGKPIWQKEAQFMPDYKGIIAVARRNKIVKSCDADVVCENDEYEFWKEGVSYHFRHRKPRGGPRGPVQCAYARLLLPDGEVHFEEMNLEELEKVRNSSTAKDSGPWVSWPDEMRKKTVLKRGLKYYADDPAVIRLIEADDRSCGFGEQEEQQPAAMPQAGQRMNLRAQPALPTPKPTIPAPWETNGQAEHEYVEAGGQSEPEHQEQSSSLNEYVLQYYDAIADAPSMEALSKIESQLNNDKPELGEEFANLLGRLGSKRAELARASGPKKPAF